VVEEGKMNTKFKNRDWDIIDIIAIVILSIVGIFTLLPFLYIVAMSLSDRTAVLTGQVTFYPIGFNLEAYKRIIAHPNFWSGYKNTILYTSVGTTVGLFISTLCAYPLSKKRLLGRNMIMKLIVFTMFFSGGLIPRFLLVRSLGLLNTIWAIVLPGAFNAFYIIVMRTFFEGIPASLEDAASIDGLNDIGILWKIYLPLSKPIMATIGLFYAVFYWNDWFSALIYLSDSSKYPITMFLRNIVMGQQLAVRSGANIQNAVQVVTPTLRSATIVLVVLPILFVYPFAQKYFVKGMTIGSVKG
jgi:putative aldouronate transport system permease protein